MLKRDFTDRIDPTAQIIRYLVALFVFETIISVVSVGVLWVFALKYWNLAFKL
jgi:hypothetical protein